MNLKQTDSLSELHIVAMGTDGDNLSQLVSGLKHANVRKITQAQNTSELKSALEQTNIDAILIEISNNHGKELSEILEIAGYSSCAVALFLDSRIDINLGRIIDAGFCTVVVDGLAAQRIPHLLETTMHRYQKMRGMQIQLEEAFTALEERKMLDKAKGILMAQRQINEPEAYKILRKAAMNRNCKISEIAHSIIIASEV